MSDVDTTRKQTMRNKDLRAYIAQRMSNSVVTRHFSCFAEECDDHRKTDSPINEVMEAIEGRLAEARNVALDDLLEAMPEKYKYRHKHDIQSENGKYMCLNCKKSPDDILGNDGTGYCPHFRSFNEAVDLATTTIHQLKSSKKGDS